jgi:hypothetical protein
MQQLRDAKLVAAPIGGVMAESAECGLRGMPGNSLQGVQGKEAYA